MAAGPISAIAVDGPVGERLAARSALRKSLLDRRLALTAEQCAQLSGRVCAHLRDGFPHLSALAVGFCWPLKNEADLRPLIEEWASAGKQGFSALLPVVIDEQQALAFRAWSADSVMFADRYGIPTPAGGDFLIPEALLLPVNGFDLAGYRLGYGGGYFDRTLALLSPRPLVVGVGFELGRLDTIVPQPHDQPLDAVVTEAGIFRPLR
ncbi:5-formyltetrahydrofolate cyclo-ligase [Candidatus Accumulibacter sp. ACC007]|uniref:5-formyltetrahydrofolate cyclo-ligase n=1 Tax=Candidatus Accumulibacter sp. ACC007 TaxID=2823333 RepID=UPI0025B88FEA|nr:5-formyltetrahydrofolate cyclo-ligase [Candidatus Accumulibacter sp. ACC007]